VKQNGRVAGRPTGCFFTPRKSSGLRSTSAPVQKEGPDKQVRPFHTAHSRTKRTNNASKLRQSPVSVLSPVLVTRGGGIMHLTNADSFMKLPANDLRIFQRSKPKGSFVTIVIGIKCKQAIVMACDSRTTEESGFVKDDAEKMRIVKFAKGKVLLAYSGSVAYGSRAFRLFEEMAAQESIENDYTVTQTLQRAVVKTLEEMFLPFKKSQFSQAEVDQKVRGYRFDLIAAFYHDKKPFVFTIKSTEPVAIELRSNGAIGCGSEVAEFVMKWFPFPDLDVLYSSIAATYVIQRVIETNGFCGYPIHIAAVSPSGNIGLQPEASTAEIATALQKKNQANTQAWAQQMKVMLLEILQSKPKEGKKRGLDFMKIH
jgi:20S proteasome alpha/beta subunit